MADLQGFLGRQQRLDLFWMCAVQQLNSEVLFLLFLAVTALMWWDNTAQTADITTQWKCNSDKMNTDLMFAVTDYVTRITSQSDLIFTPYWDQKEQLDAWRSREKMLKDGLRAEWLGLMWGVMDWRTQNHRCGASKIVLLFLSKPATGESFL